MVKNIKKVARKFARYQNLSLYLHSQKERCRSGRSGRTRNAVNGQLFRGFESLPLRKITKQKGVEKSTPFVLFLPSASLLAGGGKENKIATCRFCAVSLQGPLRRAVGKGVKRSRLQSA